MSLHVKRRAHVACNFNCLIGTERLSKVTAPRRIVVTVIMVALYVIGQTVIFLPCGFFLSIFFFFPRLISAAINWMSTILLHMAWPQCEFRMQVRNVLLAARCKYRTQKSRQKSPSGHHRTTSSGYNSQLRHVSTIGNKSVKQQYVLHKSPQYGELRPTNG